MENIKFKIYTLGCKVNQCDSNKIKSELQSAGFDFVRREADLAIINTCAVTKTAIRKCRQILTKARKENPRARIVLAGCWPKVYTDKTIKQFVDEVWAGDNSGLVKKVLKSEILTTKSQKNPKSAILNPKYISRSRYFLKVQDGCEQFCSYCIIPYTRGKMTSRKAAEVLAEAEAAVKSGFKEIVICGIHLGLYGRETKNKRTEPNKQKNLAGLLREIISIEGLGRIRLSSIEVTEVSVGLIDLIKNNNKICPHLHIPLQSGSGRILKSMNRPYGTKYYENKINKIRKDLPKAAITTDVIVGFPGETEADFKKTCEFAKKMKFSRLHVFPFSAHVKTPAAKLPGQIDVKTKARRAGILRSLGEKLNREYIKKFRGYPLRIAVEKADETIIKGISEYYFEVSITGRKLREINNKTPNIKPKDIIRLAKF